MSGIHIGNVAKLAGLVLGIALVNIIVLSPAFIGIEIGASALHTATGLTVLVMSALIVLYGGYSLLFRRPVVLVPLYVPKEMKTRDDYIAALRQFGNAKPLQKDIALALNQLDRIDKKKHALMQVLQERFDETELSFKKFVSVIYEVEKLFYMNIRGILNKLGVFDATELANLGNPHQSARFSQRLAQAKTALYNEYLSYVEGYLGANEEIFLKLDKLLLEISLLGSANYTDVDDMPCMQEIDALIKQTKYYRA